MVQILSRKLNAHCDSVQDELCHKELMGEKRVLIAEAAPMGHS